MRTCAPSRWPVRELRSNDPAHGYNRWPRHAPDVRLTIVLRLPARVLAASRLYASCDGAGESFLGGWP